MAEMTTPHRATSDARWILLLLFAANLLNFYDRTIPAIVVEPLKAEFSLTDSEIGLLTAAFTLVYAVCGIPLARLADRRSRRIIMAVGLAVWSLLTGATGLATGFAVLVIIRLLLGVGEASFAPAANSMIADLYPSTRRSRPTGVLQLGLPVGLVLAYFTVGAITEAYGTWRAAFFIAALPGLIIAILLVFIREPARGATETITASTERIARPFRTVLRIPTIWWLILAGVGTQISTYAVATFSVPLFQRYFGTTLTVGGMLTGVTIGVTGLIGLGLGGRVADRWSRRSHAARVATGAVALLAAAPIILVAFLLGAGQIGLFVGVFSIGWLLAYGYYTAAYPAVADVVVPRLRATAMSLYFAAFYLLGGALGPLFAGALSDRFAAAAPGPVTARALAEGLHTSLAIVIPLGLLVGAVGLFGASRTVGRDRDRMLASLERA